MRRKTFASATALALALAACSGGADEDGSEIAADPGNADAVPTYTDDTAPSGPEGDEGVLGSDAVMQGQWFDTRMDGHPAALFGPPASEALFSVHCEAGELVFMRSVLVESGTASMQLMAGGQTRTIAADAQQDPLPQVTGRLPASDPFAATLGSATEPIAVAVDGGPSYRLPASETLRDVVRNCG